MRFSTNTIMMMLKGRSNVISFQYPDAKLREKTLLIRVEDFQMASFELEGGVPYHIALTQRNGIPVLFIVLPFDQILSIRRMNDKEGESNSQLTLEEFIGLLKTVEQEIKVCKQCDNGLTLAEIERFDQIDQQNEARGLGKIPRYCANCQDQQVWDQITTGRRASSAQIPTNILTQREIFYFAVQNTIAETETLYGITSGQIAQICDHLQKEPIRFAEEHFHSIYLKLFTEGLPHVHSLENLQMNPKHWQQQIVILIAAKEDRCIALIFDKDQSLRMWRKQAEVYGFKTMLLQEIYDHKTPRLCHQCRTRPIAPDRLFFCDTCNL